MWQKKRARELDTTVPNGLKYRDCWTDELTV
jgi:hypothetical protein